MHFTALLVRLKNIAFILRTILYRGSVIIVHCSVFVINALGRAAKTWVTSAITHDATL